MEAPPMIDPDAPEERTRAPWSIPPPSPAEEPAAEPRELGEEFLFHLYRGSELLKEDQVYEAKSELERAIALQPRDIEGQGLLGVVYFRLGHYPRAIQIYEELVRARPTEVAPRVNLALCFLKTGQLQQARALLEEIIAHRPDHVRAWGYLGLVYQRAGDLDKASIAFERAGRPNLAARLRSASDADAAQANETSIPASPRVPEIPHNDVGVAPSTPPPAMPNEGVVLPARHSSFAPAVGTQVSVPLPVGRLARENQIVFPEKPRVARHSDGTVLVRVSRSFAARSDCVRVLISDGAAPFKTKTLKRIGRGLFGDEPLGGLATPFAMLEGAGRLVLGPPEPWQGFVTSLDGEPLYILEDRLIGFDGAVEHESNRLGGTYGDATGVVSLSGVGYVALATRGPVHSIELVAERPIEVRGDRLVGWVGRLLARPMGPELAPGFARGFIALSGTGLVLMDAG